MSDMAYVGLLPSEIRTRTILPKEPAIAMVMLPPRASDAALVASPARLPPS